MLGQYFNIENQSPVSAMNVSISEIEEYFNNYMIKMADELSGRNLKNISLLDLPAFGAKDDTKITKV